MMVIESNTYCNLPIYADSQYSTNFLALKPLSFLRKAFDC